MFNFFFMSIYFHILMIICFNVKNNKKVKQSRKLISWFCLLYWIQNLTSNSHRMSSFWEPPRQEGKKSRKRDGKLIYRGGTEQQSSHYFWSFRGSLAFSLSGIESNLDAADLDPRGTTNERDLLRHSPRKVIILSINKAQTFLPRQLCPHWI